MRSIVAIATLAAALGVPVATEAPSGHSDHGAIPSGGVPGTDVSGRAGGSPGGARAGYRQDIPKQRSSAEERDSVSTDRRTTT